MGPGATSVDFVTGNSGGIVAADSGYNIFILGDNLSGINTVGNLSPNTLTIFGEASSTTQVGTTRYATNVEAAAQTIGTAALTPANITSLFSTNYLPSSQGGTGLSSPAAHQLIVTAGSSPYTLLGVAANGQIPIGSVGGDPVLGTITAGTGISVTNGPGTITISAMTGTLTWQTITASQTLAIDHGYICISPGAALSLLLPAVSSVGDIIEVTLDGSTSFSITQSAGQQIRIGNTATTAGVTGSLTSTQQGDSIRMVCSVANLKWNVLSSMGNPTVA
jgi:hypothetical protein